jgi:arsenate reductase (glutaredoxin)
MPDSPATFTIYHNPRCSKSRETLDLLTQHGIAPEVVHYLTETPDAATLKALLKKLGLPARTLLREKEDEYKALGLDNPALTDDAIIALMVQHPKLIERPVVVKGDRAVLGRPPENVLQLF